jgi:hypothetical protein
MRNDKLEALSHPKYMYPFFHFIDKNAYSFESIIYTDHFNIENILREGDTHVHFKS